MTPTEQRWAYAIIMTAVLVIMGLGVWHHWKQQPTPRAQAIGRP